MNDVTEILSAIENGDPRAAKDLLPLVYDELRRLASAKLVHEKPGHTLQPTALVHEAYLRLVKDDDAAAWNSRGHFFGAAAEAMRRILIENARRRKAARRGGGFAQIPLTECTDVAELEDQRLLNLDESLKQLHAEQPVIGRLVELRYFAGLTNQQAAAALKIAPRTADRYWVYAKAWLSERMQ